MAFLRLNGWTIPIAAAKATRSWKRSGARAARTMRGSVVDARRNLRRTWECEACFLNPDDADGLINLLSGSGHYFDLLDGFAASTGLQPIRQIAPGAIFRPTMAGIDDSMGGLSYTSVGEIASIDAQVDEWTVLLSSMKENAWVTGALRDDGISYERGVKSESFGKRGRWTNLVPFSEDWTVSWAYSAGVTPTPLVGIAPNNATSTRLSKTSGTSSTGTSINLSGVAYTVLTVSIYVKKGSATTTAINLYDATAVANRHIVLLNWTASSPAPTISTQSGNGHLFDVENAGSGWYRVSFTAESINPANANQLYIYPAGLGTATGNVEVFGAQVENAFIPGPYVKASGSATTGPKEVYIEASDGVVTLTEEGGSRVIDDLIILPWRASEAQMAAWTVRGSRWGPLPLLRLDGEILEGAYDSASFGSTLVVGEVLSVDFVQKPTNISGIGWVNNAKIVRFQLGEVDETFKLAQSYRDNSGYAPPGSPILRYDAANIDGLGNASLTEGATVTSWKNLGTLAGRQNTATGTAIFTHRAMPKRLLSSLNHTPGVDFNGTSHFLRAPTLSSPLTQTPAIIIACLAITDTVSTTRYAYDSNVTASSFRWRFASTVITFSKSLTVTYTGVTASAGKALLSIGQNANISPSPFKVSGGTTQNLNVSGLTYLFYGLTLGASNQVTPTFFHDGKIIELIAWREDSAPSFDAIEEYFHRRYGFLPQTG